MRNGFQAGAGFLFRSGHHELRYPGDFAFLLFCIVSGVDRDTALVFLRDIYGPFDRADAFYIQDITPALDQYAGEQAKIKFICRKLPEILIPAISFSAISLFPLRWCLLRSLPDTGPHVLPVLSARHCIFPGTLSPDPGPVWFL